MDLFRISDGKKCEDICKYAPPENKWPCVDCDMRCHDGAELKEEVVKKEIKEAIDYLDWYFEADDGTADKDAQKAWCIIKNYLICFSTQYAQLPNAENIRW